MNCPKCSLNIVYKAQVIFILLVLLSSCSTSSNAVETSGSSGKKTSANTSIVKKDRLLKERATVIKTARQQLGKNYRYAGTGPDHWDCSGLTTSAYQRISVKLPRTSRAMAKLEKDIGVKKAKPGDLIFFQKEGRVFHVSVITENANGKLWVVHSTTSRGVIEEDILESTYWKKKIYKVISLEALKQR